MNNTDKVSIIVPACNVEKYIENSIESLLKQSYQNIEIIIVVNNSHDKTQYLAEALSQKDNRIKLFVNKEPGVSLARNTAIDNSTGKYLMFMDADDYYDTTMVEQMVSGIQMNNAQMAICNYYDVYNSQKIADNTTENKNGIYSIVDYLRNNTLAFHTLYFGVLWNKVYLTKIIKDNAIRFDSDISLGEDSLFNLQYYKYISDIYIDNNRLYFHNESNEDSITKTVTKYNMWMMSIKRYEECIGLYSYYEILDECKRGISSRILSDVILPIEEVIKQPSNNKTKKEKLNNILDKNVVLFAYKNADKIPATHKIIKYFRWSYGLLTLLLNIKLRLFA